MGCVTADRIEPAKTAGNSLSNFPGDCHRTRKPCDLRQSTTDWCRQCPLQNTRRLPDARLHYVIDRYDRSWTLHGIYVSFFPTNGRSVKHRMNNCLVARQPVVETHGGHSLLMASFLVSYTHQCSATSRMEALGVGTRIRYA